MILVYSSLLANMQCNTTREESCRMFGGRIKAQVVVLQDHMRSYVLEQCCCVSCDKFWVEVLLMLEWKGVFHCIRILRSVLSHSDIVAHILFINSLVYV